jgi:hypothetical protein
MHAQAPLGKYPACASTVRHAHTAVIVRTGKERRHAARLFRRSTSACSAATSPRVPRFTVGRQRTALARAAKRSVECVSAAFPAAGLTQAMIAVLLLPPSESWPKEAARRTSEPLLAQLH